MLPKPAARDCCGDESSLVWTRRWVLQPTTVQGGFVRKGFNVGQEKSRFLQPLCLEAVLDSIHGIKDHPWSCCSPGPAADEIPDPWTASKFKYPEDKLLNLSSLIHCNLCPSAADLNFLLSLDPSQIFQTEISIFSSISCTQL